HTAVQDRFRNPPRASVPVLARGLVARAGRGAREERRRIGGGADPRRSEGGLRTPLGGAVAGAPEARSARSRAARRLTLAGHRPPGHDPVLITARTASA